MTPEVRAFVVRSFCRQMTAVEVAYCANNLFDVHGSPIDAAAVRKIWNAERGSNTVIRQLEEQFGERPARGFDPCEHTRLAEQLVVV